MPEIRCEIRIGPIKNLENQNNYNRQQGQPERALQLLSRAIHAPVIL